MTLIFNNIVLLILWTFQNIYEYTLPVVEWLGTSSTHIQEKKEDDGNVMVEKEKPNDGNIKDEIDGQEMMKTVIFPTIVLSDESDKVSESSEDCNDMSIYENNFLNVSQRSTIHECKSMPDLLQTDPLITAKEVKPRPSSNPLELQEWGKSQTNISTQVGENHKFVHKFSFSSETCVSCMKKIKFGQSHRKCKKCKSVCHTSCLYKVKDMPCTKTKIVPDHGTLNYGKNLVLGKVMKKGELVPHLMKRCIEEIESRGLEEEGIYRISGSDKEIRILKKKFLSGDPNIELSELDIHVVCGTLKDFLRSLTDPLIPTNMWHTVTQAASSTDYEGFHMLISSLPSANIACLTSFITHLQKVVMVEANKMTRDNLGKILGPTVIGYSSNDPTALEMIEQTPVLARCMLRLLELEF